MNASDVVRRLRAELWRAPRAHGEVERNRTVGQLELFYDLAVVVLVAQAAHRLATHLTVPGLGQFVVVFAVVWIAWFNGTFLHDLHGREDVRSRNSFLVQIMLLVPLGAYIPGAGGVHGLAFAVTAAMLFVLLAFLWWRVSRADTEEFARPTRFYVRATLGLAAGFAVSAPLPSDIRLTAWGMLSILYLAVVALLFRTVPGQFDSVVAITDSLMERFGLLVIIVLGETLTGVVSGLANDPTDPQRLFVAFTAVLLGFGSWWTYFDFVGHRPPRGSRPATSGWLFVHLPLTGAVACIGASMATVVGAAGAHRTPQAPAWMLCGSAAMVLVATVVLMTTLEAWTAARALMRPLAGLNLLAALSACAVGVIRPGPLVLCVLLAVTFAVPWTFAVVRRAMLENGPTQPGNN